MLAGIAPGVPPVNAYYNAVAADVLRRLAGEPAWAGAAGVFHAPLADPVWQRFDGCEPLGLAGYSPDVRSFEAVYQGREAEPAPGERFFGGAPFAHHAHGAHKPNRAAQAPGSWGAELLRRHRALLEAKQC